MDAPNAENSFRVVLNPSISYRRSMKYQELFDGVKCFEHDLWFGDMVYFDTLQELKTVQDDVRTLTLDTVKDVVKIYLYQWGQMARQVGQADADWVGLWKALVGKAGPLNALMGTSFLDSHDQIFYAGLEDIYNGVFARRIGDTSVSKILHLVNPQLFVMWDGPIRTKLRRTHNLKRYEEYLQLSKNQVLEAMNEIGVSVEADLVERISNDLASDSSLNPMIPTLCREKTLAKLTDEYWWCWANRDSLGGT